MLEVLIGLVACSSPDPESLRSQPTAATVVFEEVDKLPADQEIVWTELEELFPKVPASLPPALSALSPGMDGTRAHAVLDAAHAPGTRVFGERIGEIRVAAATLAGTTQVGVSLLFASDDTLSAVDVSVPDDVAVPMLTTRWGSPDTVEHLDGGAPLYRWTGDPWRATLYGKPGEKAVVKFTSAAAAPPGQLPPITEAIPPESH